jgi:hypothetical protein
MNIFIIFLLKKAKKFVDNLYYNKYHIGKEEPLVRKMFPWITQVSEYRFVWDYLKDKTAHDISDLNKLVLSYYWWEVNMATTNKKFDRIEHLNSLIEFTESISDYHSEVLISNNTENAESK